MTDILKPELIWIEGRCYRVNDPTSQLSSFQEHDLYEEEAVYKELDDEEDDFEVETIDNNRYCARLHISKHYIGSIIGKKGFTKVRIERDTRTEIKIPRQGQSGDIVIYGPSAVNVKAACRRINIIVVSSRMKRRPTHFISLPLNRSDIMKNFENFKESVLRECSGLDESLFIKPHKLHATFGVMCLMDNEERLQASKLLAEAKENIIKPLLRDHLPLRIRLKGLDYMNDDPKAIHVLYGLLEDENSLGLIQELADGIVQYFIKEGFMQRDFDRDNVKLHVTLMNTKYLNRSSTSDVDESPKSKGPRVAFDGTEVLRKFSDYDFGVTELTEIHLSQHHSTGEDGYYQQTFVVSCND